MNIIILILSAVVLFSVFLAAHSRHRSPAKSAIVNMVTGVLSLAIIAPIASVAVNLFTVFAALTLGVPGTALVVVMNIAF
jgi:hypothetical protein